MTDEVTFVLGSAARRSVVAALAEGPEARRTLVRTTDASESAVYDAIGALAERGLVTERDSEWSLTGAGQLVADAVAHCDGIEAVLADDRTYWSSHDPTGLPDRFRRTVGRLAGCTVIRSDDGDPYRATRRVERAIEDADTVATVAPVSSTRVADALVTSAASERRLVTTPSTIEGLLAADSSGIETGADQLPIRVTPAAVSVTVTDRELFCSLPTVDGGLDVRTVVHADGKRALAWGEALVDHYWRVATPVSEWIERAQPAAATADTPDGKRSR